MSWVVGCTSGGDCIYWLFATATRAPDLKSNRLNCNGDEPYSPKRKRAVRAITSIWKPRAVAGTKPPGRIPETDTANYQTEES